VFSEAPFHQVKNRKKYSFMGRFPADVEDALRL
jgi:hypothetical protein